MAQLKGGTLPIDLRQLIPVPISDEDIARFFKYVNKSSKNNGNRGCHIWTGFLNQSGYGQFRMTLPEPHGPNRPQTYPAHRVAWWIHYKKHNYIPPKFVLLHICDFRACVNPRHLTLGSQGANMQDMVLKGRNGNKYKLGIHQRTDA